MSATGLRHHGTFRVWTDRECDHRHDNTTFVYKEIVVFKHIVTGKMYCAEDSGCEYFPPFRDFKGALPFSAATLMDLSGENLENFWSLLLGGWHGTVAEAAKAAVLL